MKNKLGYLLMVLLVLTACRTDHLQEEKARNVASESMLRSKIISLNESVHKNKLQPYLIDMKEKIKHKSKQDINALGRIINYGDSISIDTDEVIYIEYKSYHTYTFKIKRNGSEGNAPVENLILSLEPDGSYKELMKTYNFSEDDFYELSRGNGIDLKGKSYTVELEKGTFVSASQARSFCHYESQTIIRVCKSTDHHANNINDWHKCDYIGNDAPKIFTIEILVCEEDSNAIMGGWDVNQPPNSYTGGGDPISGGNNNPQPENPNDVEDAQNELGGVISTPNLGIPHPNDTPCAKTKAMLQKPEVQEKIGLLKTKSKTKGEQGVNFALDGTPSAVIDGGDHEVYMGDSAGNQGGYHNHTPTGIKMLSPPDILALFNYAMNFNNGNTGDAFFGMVGSDICTACPGGYKYYNYVIRFNGTYQELAALVFANWDRETLRDTYRTRASELSDNSLYYDYQLENLKNIGLEKLFFDTLKNMSIENKVTLQRIDDDGTVQNITLENNEPKATPCP